eukprot:14222930-Ditylum_brightwellii.AAC.1
MGASESKRYRYTGGEGDQDEYGNYVPAAPINVTTVKIDPSVKKIGNGAFCECKKLKNIILPEGVEVV